MKRQGQRKNKEQGTRNKEQGTGSNGTRERGEEGAGGGGGATAKK